MTSAEPPAEDEVESRLCRDIEAYHTAALLYAAAKLGLPDKMGTRPWEARQLAEELELSPPHLLRFLRALATLGVCRETQEGAFEMTPAGNALKPLSPWRLYEKVRIVVEQYWQPWTDLVQTLRTGEPAFNRVFGMGVWDWRREHADHGALFDAYYGPETSRHADALSRVPAFAEAGTVADIGGGSGAMLAALLHAHPNLHGILFDKPQTVARAEALFRSCGLPERVQCVGGDFLTEIPIKADLYIVKHVLHDWDDSGCRKILTNCRRTMPDDAKLLVVERILPERANDDPAAIMLDLHMMVVTGGRERSLAEFEEMLTHTGFAISDTRTVPLGLSVIEAIPA